MMDGPRAKFTDEKFRTELLATGDELIYEDSPTDAIWGLWNQEEQAWTGQNLLGKALMQLREELRL
jgi:ribA/ribD-fused uncharacterized protein